MAKSVLERIKSGKTIISDGAWGTLFHEKGLKPGECPELWNLTNPGKVLEIAKSYVDAGSDMIETNSFGGSVFKLEHYGLSDKVFELNKAAAEISRNAAGNSVLVLGSIGPTGKMLIMGDVTKEQLYDAFRDQSMALEKGGADAICIETMIALDEAVLAVKAAKENTTLEVICTMTFDKTVSGEFRTMMGIDIGQMVAELKSAGADIIGTNCGNGMENMIPIVREIRKHDPEIPVLVHANAGLPHLIDGKNVFDETPEVTSSFVQELILSGANAIGGCCGTTPEHIKAIKREVR